MRCRQEVRGGRVDREEKGDMGGETSEMEQEEERRAEERGGVEGRGGEEGRAEERRGE